MYRLMLAMKLLEFSLMVTGVTFTFFSESPAMSDLAVIFAAERWAPLWSCKHVIIHSDSQVAVGIINKGSIKNSLIMGFFT